MAINGLLRSVALFSRAFLMCCVFIVLLIFIQLTVLIFISVHIAAVDGAVTLELAPMST